MKVLFAGTPEFAVAPLAALSEQHDIVAVYTQPDRKSGRGKRINSPPVKQFAQAHEIPIHQPSSLVDQVETIQAYHADVMVVVAYGMLLPQAILDIPPLGCINIHASILPRWRGAAPIQRAIEAGDSETGVSIMRMELGLDTGPVFQTLRTPIGCGDTSQSLHNRLAELGAQGICNTLATLAETPNFQPIEQMHDKSTYAKKIIKDEASIDWSLSAAEVDRKLRAFVPWPGCQTVHQNTRLRIWGMSVEAHDHALAPGTIINIADNGPLIACAENAVRLEILQRDGSKAMPFKEFRNGYELVAGETLG